ncbi:hypothetical protein [Streptomyces coeruleorubidus]|uniref:Uncharacterized protein n=1 Tax=Streptomyces coeruleorubidus TaxID=116188 RepID=A0ABZ0KT61_STRC4|nr:hypothetical protein [Streptomyces coeruleorubidus]WOT40664.1 hypothetical protein R5U08_41985 [Streptomyces coeruleorubidus]
MAPQMSPRKAAHWNARFEQACAAGEKGPEEFFRAWLDLVKVSAIQKVRASGDHSTFNTLSAELERIYREHCQ